ncbi:transglutaminase family protein [Nodosilinea sp. P-1105]|uniref:transglutaminase-like domain-containing protein n=1 Tax=Nodosilinea sp. P-1105 TaxID=2546229 RepID=UPI00146F5F62|nr:transglutaminase family protein [Nodosilinea sp. P-1105]NMF81895.1 transglutaminase family protein [Nodosilinea sp. P-1105]
MRLNAGCELLFETAEPTPLILMLRSRDGDAQRIIQNHLQFDPQVPVIDYADSYGNLCQRLVAPPGQLRVRSTVTADVADSIDVQFGAEFVPVQDLPAYTLPFLLPSRYCQSDLMADLANAIVANIEPAYDQVDAIRHWIHTHIEYRYDTSDASTSALETEKNRVGVCRDFVHLGLTLCRSLAIPARMVVGYLYDLKPMDLHAWFEAYVGDRWYTFDPTQAEPRGNRIIIAYGRDAADVALATQYGPVTLTEMEVWVQATS